MARSKKSHPKKLSQKLIRHYFRLPKTALYLTTAVLAIGLSLALLSLNSLYRDHERWLAAQGNYQNLDLALASHASYSNQPISIAKSLDSAKGVKKYIFGFNVPKDRLSEFGLMATPSTPAPKKGYPVIIMCHSYVNPQDYSTVGTDSNDVSFYAQHGFAVLKPDFRGQGLSLASGAADGDLYSMGYNTDVLSLIAAVKKTPGLDKHDINLWGHSMGAYVALRATVLSRDVKSAVLLSGPVGTPQDMYSLYSAISDSNNPAAAEVKYAALTQYGTPFSNPSFWATTSPLTYLKKTKAFIQIHVGSADRIVPPRFSADLNKALDEAHKPHQYFVYQNGNHGLEAERPQIWQRSLAIFNKY